MLDNQYLRMTMPEQGLLALTQDTFDTQRADQLIKDPDKLKEVLIQIALRFSNLSSILNQKDTGLYLTTDFLSGRQYFPTINPTVMRPSVRHIVDFGALPNAGLKSVAHGINVTATTIWTNIYGTATLPGVQGIPLPYVSLVANASISLNVDAINVNITTAVNYSSYTTCYVVLEFIR